ncbi:MAG TPA: hypothetical protein VK140_02900 [Ktedonobacteraceae bacterium]|nr:hypothetical protein [Ktedonobacteraceae bacterium]
MLKYAETASSSTIVPLVSVPYSQCEERISDHTSSSPSSSASSYAIGPSGAGHELRRGATFGAGRKRTVEHIEKGGRHHATGRTARH